MKTTSLPSLLLAAALTAGPLLAAAPERGETRTIEIRTDTDTPNEPVTFLGVETAPAGATLADQLGLPAGVGLVVATVVPDSPAAAALKPHDLLTKLNDQILIDTHQLAVLVRTYRDGDEVSLTYVRGGKEATAKVKLVRRTLPHAIDLRSLGAGGNHFFHLRSGGLPGAAMNAVWAEAPETRRTVRVIHQGQAGAVGGTSLRPADGTMMFSDESGSLNVATKGGVRTLVAKDPQGKTLFDGPVDTPEQRKALPADVRARFDRMEHLDFVSFDAAAAPLPAPAPRAEVEIESLSDDAAPVPAGPL